MLLLICFRNTSCLYKVEATDRSKNHCTPLLRLWYTHPPPKLLELLTSRSSPWATVRKLPKGSVFIILLSPIYRSTSRNPLQATTNPPYLEVFTLPGLIHMDSTPPFHGFHMEWFWVRSQLFSGSMVTLDFIWNGYGMAME